MKNSQNPRIFLQIPDFQDSHSGPELEALYVTDPDQKSNSLFLICTDLREAFDSIPKNLLVIQLKINGSEKEKTKMDGKLSAGKNCKCRNSR